MRGGMLFSVYLVMAWAAGWLVIRSPGDRPIAGLSLAIQGLAVVEYGISVLADAMRRTGI